MGRRRQGREGALHALYLADVAPAVATRAFSFSVEIDDQKTLDFSRELFEGVLKRRSELDEHIERTAKNWSLPRMTAVDRNILRLAAYELLFHADTPVKVVIDESIEIARKYSTEDSSAFINGVLDKIKNLRKLRHDPSQDPG